MHLCSTNKTFCAQVWEVITDKLGLSQEGSISHHYVLVNA